MKLFRRLKKWWARATGREGLYARIEGRELLQHEAREEILDHLKREPGLSFQEIQDRIGLAPGTTKWHLEKLSKSSFIASTKDGRHRRYYPRGMDKAEVRAVVALKDPSRLALARMVLRNPGINQGDLARATGLAQSTVSHHLDRLIEDGMVRKWKDGRVARHEISQDQVKVVRRAIRYVM
ncbi:MAG: winged helix-turn-helix transcriptional regulator [Candidatus Thermoplasmatota archaeon]|nr:winged helix-turn-helix transcriptional regulator [Candidatus Thermoplasmatota archaeon]